MESRASSRPADSSGTAPAPPSARPASSGRSDQPTLFDLPAERFAASPLPSWSDEPPAPLQRFEPSGAAPPPAGAHAALVRLKRLPGPMSMQMLIRAGILEPLDDRTAYRTADGASLYGRAAIAAELLPQGVAACARTAAWVWAGGPFPPVIDLLTQATYHAPICGHPLRSFNRQVPREDRVMLGPLELTTPCRTVCDLLLLPYDEVRSENLDAQARKILDAFHITVGDCLELLERIRYLRNGTQARALLREFEIGDGAALTDTMENAA